MRLTPHVGGPDPESRTAIFRDGPDGVDAFQVALWPAMFPVRFTQGATPSGLSELIFSSAYIFIGGHLSLLFDRRYKVVVSRRPQKRAHLWRVVYVAFFDRFDDAEAHNNEILKQWDYDFFAGAPTMSTKDLRLARLESKADNGRRAWPTCFLGQRTELDNPAATPPA